MRRLIAVALLVAACSGSGPTAAPTRVRPTTAPLATQTASPASAPPTQAPAAIPGLTNADIKLNFEDSGFTCDGPAMTGGVASWTCTDTVGLADLEVRYWGPDPLTVQGVDGQTILAPDDLAAEFLGYLATLPYEGSDPARARAWVSDRIGRSVETDIGGAHFVLGGPEGARHLTITPRD